MTDKVLPPGDYAIRLHVVGSAEIDGNVLFTRLAITATPEEFAAFATKGLEMLMPRKLGRIVAGSWLLVTVDWNVGFGLDGCAVAEQVAVPGDVEPSGFHALLATEIPHAVEFIAGQMLNHIGIDPIHYHAPDKRPSLLN